MVANCTKRLLSSKMVDSTFWSVPTLFCTKVSCTVCCCICPDIDASSGMDRRLCVKNKQKCCIESTLPFFNYGYCTPPIYWTSITHHPNDYGLKLVIRLQMDSLISFSSVQVEELITMSFRHVPWVK
jgi:hypothetical protein